MHQLGQLLLRQMRGGMRQRRRLGGKARRRRQELGQGALVIERLGGR